MTHEKDTREKHGILGGTETVKKLRDTLDEELEKAIELDPKLGDTEVADSRGVE